MSDTFAVATHRVTRMPLLDIGRRLHADEPRFMATAIAMALLIVPLAGAAMIDTRTHLGIGIWIKPIKFAGALSVYSVTLAFFARWMTREFRSSAAFRRFAVSVVAAIAAEMTWIVGAAAFGTVSHFNTTEPLMVALYPVMGALATLLTAAAAVYAWGIARNPATGLPGALKESLVTGLALTLPLTLVTAGTMAGMSGHAVGGSGSDAGGLWLMGWLRDGGDLRVPHFFATHAMHAVPVFGLLALTLSRRNQHLAVRLSAVLYTAFVLYTLVEALSGRPFLPMIG